MKAKDSVLTRRMQEIGMQYKILAPMIGYHTGSLSHLLHGKGYLNYRTAMAITKAVGLDDPRILFDDEGRVRP